MARTNWERRRDQMLKALANDALNIPVLERQGSDRADFHELPGWAIKYALRQAYNAGYEQAIADREHHDADLVHAAFACPSCGQRDADRLLCDEDGEHVDCQACGTRYRIEQNDGGTHTSTIER